MYAYGGDQWIAYDDVKTIGIKAQYIKDKVNLLEMESSGVFLTDSYISLSKGVTFLIFKNRST